jgi:hypothetical protein
MEWNGMICLGLTVVMLPMLAGLNRTICLEIYEAVRSWNMVAVDVTKSAHFA